MHTLIKDSLMVDNRSTLCKMVVYVCLYPLLSVHLLHCKWLKGKLTINMLDNLLNS